MKSLRLSFVSSLQARKLKRRLIDTPGSTEGGGAQRLPPAPNHISLLAAAPDTFMTATTSFPL